ncbi:MAG TPA: HAMP domain-containing sensor histidine kinase [Balneolaceae bacterium]|nr:HAMP domain-containing sensor histidine kinase [Balneolaceae bacterium]
MKIRSKLAWTFIILLFIGINAICSYAIIYIKNYIEKKGVRELKQDTRSLAVTISNLPPSPHFKKHFDEVTKTSGYQLALYDSTGTLIYSYPANVSPATRLPDDERQTLVSHSSAPWMPSNKEQGKKLIGFTYLPQSINRARYLRVSQFKSRIYAPVKKIRWIIYYGIFASIALAVVVSIWIARYLTKPITQIKDAAQKIAEGDVNQKIDVKRNDEFGALADSLNQMASKLREDTEQIKRYAVRQRQFFADITHEIRNPLHTISASLEMLELDELPAEKEKQYRKNAQSQVQRINRLFKDLKTLQQYDSDDHFIEKQVFDFADISSHMKDWYDGEAREKGLNLSVDTHSCKAIGDPGKIEQVLDNLISNAIKYTNEGSVDLHYFEDNDQLSVEVSDTGIGISEEHLDRLFDRFYRTDKARSREKGGTGLGLSVVRSILQAHDTEIEVESEPGEGSVFRFRLPLG